MDRDGIRGAFFNVGKLLISLSVCLLLTMLGVMVLSLLVLTYHFSEDICKKGVLVIYGVSVFAGGYVGGRIVKRYNFVVGILTGMLYFFSIMSYSVMYNYSMNGEYAVKATEVGIKLLLMLSLGAGGGYLSELSYRKRI